VYRQLTSVVAVHFTYQVPVNGIATQLLLTHLIQLNALQPRPTSVIHNLNIEQRSPESLYIGAFLAENMTEALYLAERKVSDRKFYNKVHVFKVTECQEIKKADNCGKYTW